MKKQNVLQDERKSLLESEATLTNGYQKLCSVWKKTFKPLLRNLYVGLEMYLVALVGYIPLHFMRNFLYRIVFGIKMGKQTSIHWRARFRSPRKLIVGNNCVVGELVQLDARSGISIGDNVNIGGEVAIFTLEHDPDDPYFGTKGGPVILEDYVWIGSRVTILPNITIGKGAVIATGAVVTKNVPSYQIFGGIPAKFIRKRNRDLRYSLNFKLPFQ